MRNKRGAVWALLAASAAYAWRNRDQLRQQFDSLRGTSPQSAPAAREPYVLPDYSNVEQRDSGAPATDRDREFGGTKF